MLLKDLVITWPGEENEQLAMILGLFPEIQTRVSDLKQMPCMQAAHYGMHCLRVDSIWFLSGRREAFNQFLWVLCRSS